MVHRGMLSEPREYKSQMRAMAEHSGGIIARREVLDAGITNKAKTDAAALEVISAARDTVRVAVYRTMAIKQLEEKLQKYDRLCHGEKE